MTGVRMTRNAQLVAVQAARQGPIGPVGAPGTAPRGRHTSALVSFPYPPSRPAARIVMRSSVRAVQLADVASRAAASSVAVSALPSASKRENVKSVACGHAISYMAASPSMAPSAMALVLKRPSSGYSSVMP